MSKHHHEHRHNNYLTTENTINARNLFITMALNLLITVISGSLALISDALHNFSDFIAVLVTYIAFKVSGKQNNERKTFGYKRIQILTGLFNTAVLVGITLYLFIEAYHRIVHPVPIKAGMVIGIATFGLIANALSVILLKKDSALNLNIRSAYLHLLADAFSSIIVIISAAAIYFLGWHILDPILTIFIGIFILKECYTVIKEIVNILMQSVPSHLDVKKIAGTLQEIEGVCGVHHVHLWQLDDLNIHFEGHVVAGDITLEETQPILNEIQEKLYHLYQINHVIVQFEPVTCVNTEYIAKKCTIR